MKLRNAFSVRSRPTPKGSAGYDNARENIDPHIKTKVLSFLEFESRWEDLRVPAQNTKLTGITNTRSQTVDDQENDHTIGSGKAVIIIDPAIVETKQLTSGAVFAINSKVYQDEAGKWTNTQPGTDTRVYGVALAAAVANAGDVLIMDYYGAQGPA